LTICWIFSNLLNDKAALSPEMALRLAKTFGANQEEPVLLRKLVHSTG
jgi:plasmid maintenance system antidote protein VapI